MKKQPTAPDRTAPRSSRSRKPKPPSWKIVHPHAAGIDVGATAHYVAVPPDRVPAGQPAVRRFGEFTTDLDALVEWLRSCLVETVAMESTGVYWIPLFQKLEAAGLTVVLVNARAAKHVPGRKTDVQDCQWLQQLHSYGLLAASFRPNDAICRLRTLVRHRANLVAHAAEQVMHMQAALTQMNLHLHHAVSHLTGETGLRILRAMLAGERDPEKLIQLRDAHITKSTPEQMKAALTGDWRPEQLFVLQQALRAWEFTHEQMDACDRQIEHQLKSLPTVSAPTPPPKPRAPDPLEAENPRPKGQQSRKRNDPLMDLTPELARVCGIDLTRAGGLRELSALVIVSEIGVDMSPWRSAKAFASWLGLCPNNKVSGERVLSTRTRPVINRVATALRMAATGVAESNTWLGSFHRRMRGRLGPAAAITATAHKIANVIYHLLKNKEPYVERDLVKYEQKVYRNKLNRLRKQAATMGYELVPTAEEKALAS